MESRLTWKSPGSTVPPGPPSSPDWMALTMFTMCFLECKELEPVEMTCWAIFLQNSLYNWKMIAMRVVVKPYQGILTMDDTRSLLYLVQFGTSGTCVLPSMEVFPVDLPRKHLRLLEPTKTAKALLRILTLKGFLGTPKLTACPLKTGLPKRKVVFQPSIFRGDVSFGEGNYLSSPHLCIWLSWPNFFSSKQLYGDSNLQSSLVLKKLAMRMPFSLLENGVKIRVESEVVEKVSHEKKNSYFPWVILVV